MEEIRLLLINLDEEIAAEFEALAPETLMLIRADRAGEAVRRFDAESPDAAVVVLGDAPNKTALMIEAIRDRPLGALVPILLIDKGLKPDHPLAAPLGAAEAGVDRLFTPGTHPIIVLMAVGEMLDVDFDLPEPPRVETSPTPPSIRLEPDSEDLVSLPEPKDDDSSLSEIIDPDLDEAPYSEPIIHHVSPLPEVLKQTPERPPPEPPRRPVAIPENLSGDAIRRKLRQARHEDYFALLDIRKGTDERHIEEAYQTLRSRYEPANLSRPTADRHYHDLREVCDALDDAFAVLCDETLRTEYLRALLRADSTHRA